NHAADFTNNREEEEMEDVIDDYDIPEDECLVGIIAPYNNQVRRIRKDEDIDEDFEVYTVHKYQGRQRDTIIISTVDNRYSDFVNDEHLLNVSVSRAKNQLILVTNGNEGNSGHLKNLVDYFKANGICESGEVTSLFDLIYPQYKIQLEDFLNARPSIPSYFYAPGDEPSKAEQIAYRFISKVLQDYPELSVQYECPLRLLVKDKSLFDEEELKFISNKRSHVDFLIVKKKTSEPVLAIEIDGESYHIEGSFHWQNDKLKDSIMEKCGIPLKRFRTKESIREEETLRGILNSKI
ncbi:MAG: AAA domain-containing protein, partial [Prevotellaceae bacterium]|nr:AAA domain-containing protein [Prevotellaceae bacterium]